MSLYGAREVVFRRFGGGLVRDLDPTELQDDQAAEAENVEFDALTLRTRLGRQTDNAVAPVASPVRGLFRYYGRDGATRKFLLQAGDAIYEDDGAGSLSAVVTGLTGGRPCDFVGWKERVYAGNGVDALRRRDGDGTWNGVALLSAPASAPVLGLSRSVLEAFDSGAWTLSGGSAIARSYDTEIQREGTGCLRLSMTGAGARGRYVEKAWSAGETVDLAYAEYLTLYVYASHPGEMFQIAIKDNSGVLDWARFPVFTSQQKETWTLIRVPLAAIPPASRDASPGLAIRFLEKPSGPSWPVHLYFDEARPEGPFPADRYRYYCTYAETDGEGNVLRESNPSPEASADVEGETPIEALSVSVTPSPAPSVNQIRVYRYRDTGPFRRARLVLTAPNAAATLTDRKGDGELVLDDAVELVSGKIPPPLARSYAVVNNRLLAANVTLAGEPSPPTSDDQLAYRDTFDRPDGPLGDMTSGPQWQGNTGTASISGGLLQWGAFGIIWVDTGSPDGRLKMRWRAGAQGGGLVFRHNGSGNYWIFGNSFSAVQGGYVLALAYGETGLVQPHVWEHTEALKDGDVIEVLLEGEAIIGFLNGVQVCQTEHSHSLGSTRHGLYGNGGNVVRMDDWSFRRPSEMGGVVTHTPYPWRLYLSRLGYPEEFSGSQEPDLPTVPGWLDLPTRDHLRRIVELDGMALLFCDRSLWTLEGSGWDDFVLRKRADVGLDAREAVAVTDRLVYFLAADGVRALTPQRGLDGQFHTWRLSEPVESLLREIPPARRGDAAMGVDERGRIHLSFTPAGGTVNSVALVFDPQTPGALSGKHDPARPGWTYYSNWGFSCFASLKRGSGDAGQLVGGDPETARLHYLHRGPGDTALTSDDGAPIAWRWRGKAVDAGPGRRLSWSYAGAEFDPAPGQSVTAVAVTDGSGNGGVALPLGNAGSGFIAAVKRVPGSVRGRFAQVELSGSHAVRINCRGVRLGFYAR